MRGQTIYRGKAVQYTVVDGAPGQIIGSIRFLDSMPPSSEFFPAGPNTPPEELTVEDGRRLLFLPKTFHILDSSIDFIGGRWA
jgi:hypothetical protein